MQLNHIYDLEIRASTAIITSSCKLGKWL